MESRMEAYLNAAISGNTENLPKPISRIDFLLYALVETISESGASIEEVEKIVSEKVAEIVASAPEDFNTLKEISDWIYSHEDSAAAMNTAIQKNASSIENLTTEMNDKADSDNVYDKTTSDDRFLGINATADKSIADENGDNIAESFTNIKNDIAINRTTLGCQSKNLLKNNAVTETINGVTFTINDDKSITVNGTATAQISFMINNKVRLGVGNYILTGCPSGGSWNTFYLTAYASSAWLTIPDFGNGCKIENKTVTQIVISIASGYTADNLKFYPMLRDAEITDGTYKEYKESVDDKITQNKSDIALNRTTLGTQCKNLFNPNAVSWYQPTKTSIAKDGTITSTITSDSRTWSYKNAEYFLTLSAGKYIVSTVTETIDNTASNIIGIKGYNESGTQLFNIYPNDIGTKTKSFTLTETATIAIMFKLFTQTCKIMIRDADIIDDSYEPYQPSVQEQISALISRIEALENNSTA